MALKPPDIIDCVYCGASTPSYQLISQVPRGKCPQDFISKDLLGKNGINLQPDDYICFEHEEHFRIQFRQKCRGLPFNRSFYRPSSKMEMELSCVVCSCKNLQKYHCIGRIRTLSLRNYVINEMNLRGGKSTRRGSGVTDEDYLCHKCYQCIRRDILTTQFSPVKSKQIRNCSSGSQSVRTDSTDNTDGGSILSKSENCLICNRKQTDGSWIILQEHHYIWVEILRKNNSLFAEKIKGNPKTYYRAHRKGRGNCFAKLQAEIWKYTECLFCKEKLKTDVLPLDTEHLKLAETWIKNKNLISKENLYKHEMHKLCIQKLVHEVNEIESNEGNVREEMDIQNNKDMDEATIDINSQVVEDENQFPLYDKKLLLNKLLVEIIEKHIKDEIPAHIPSVLKDLEESFEDYTEDIGILDNLSRYEMDECIENYCKNNPKMKIHQPSKKAGRLLYNSEWDLINKVYELRSGNNYNLLSEDSERKSNLETKDMFYVAREIRNHLKDEGSLCEAYARYPEVLQTLKAEDLSFTGIKINTSEDGKFGIIPPVTPSLFNFFYYSCCSDKEAELFELTFDPLWKNIYFQGYNSATKQLYARVLSLVFELLHHIII